MLNIVNVFLALHITESGWAYSFRMSRVATITKSRFVPTYKGPQICMFARHGQVAPDYVYDQIKLSCL